ncbi:VanW family protein [Lysinibacillus sp. CD3-6]|uniref:VanW family protein n=1 Tax=Lysinibacillus sp. CD3-6 TaxID=2892541 RepID=UPI0011702848|nr:VanW family protein [Lysinibacillus sp. CD3-6]UED81862.1 VanW family protein [Lysinibacillus sp. CD3-6]
MKSWIAVFCLGSTIALAGCQETLENEQIDIDDVKQPVTYTEDKEQEAGPIVVEIVDPQSLEIIHIISPQELGYETDPESYKKKIEQLAQQLARGTETVVGLDKRMVLDKLDGNGQVIKGSPLVILKESELVERVLAASVTGGKVEMPLYITKSGYYLEDIPYLEDVVVASYTTYFSSSDVGRNKNIELSAKAINNVIVGSGDTFSFNTVVGPRDEKNGYQPAPEIINKKLVMGIGGGICQTSSTLFNAVDQLPIKFVERHHHSLDVGYVPKGRDATVSYGGLDFRFQNTSDVPFLIKATYGKDFLTIEIRTSEKYKELIKS